jgi:hypothetical protein
MREFNMKNRAYFSYITGLIDLGSKLRMPRVRSSILVLPLLFAASSWAANPNALIVWDGLQSTLETDLANAFAAANPTYTVTASAGLPAACTGAPTTCLSTYKQVWDVRSFNSTPLSSTDQSVYVSYLAGGGSLFVGGSNWTDSQARDTSIVNLVAAAGGGTITLTTSSSASNPESVLPPFTTTPDSVTSITFSAPGGISPPLPTGAAFINLDTAPADGNGAGVVWPIGTLGNAPLGRLIVVLDTNFITNTDTYSESYLANLIGYLNLPAPYITKLTPNSGPIGTTVVISGGNFGATQSGGSVKFNGTLVTSILNWSNNSITVVVPAGTTTGNVVVTANAELSNGVLFTVTASPASVPTLSEGAMVLLGCCLIAIAAWRMRRNHQPSAI